MIEPFDQVRVTTMNAGFSFFEIVDDSERVLFGDWGDALHHLLSGGKVSDRERIRIRPGLVGVESVTGHHYPDILLTSHTAPHRRTEFEPTDLTWHQLGSWPVVMTTGRIELWTSDSCPAEERPLRLPPSVDGRYVMTVAVGYPDTNGKSIKEYIDDLGLERGRPYFEDPSYEGDWDSPIEGAEQFRFDFWPDQS